MKIKFSVQPNVKALIKKVQDRHDDVGIAAISITATRADVIDFSQPMFDSGLQILTSGEASQSSLLQDLAAVL